MGKPYNLLAVDPGSEKSAFLWCRVEPPERWELPFGVAPVRLAWLENSAGFSNARVRMDNHGAGPVAVEYLRGIYLRPNKRVSVVGRDQLETQLWAGTFLGLAHYHRQPAIRVTRSTATAAACADLEGGAKGDAAVRQALIDIYGGKLKAVGGGRCGTCKKTGGWIGRDRADCPNCKAGHGDTGYENPRGVFHGWTGSHGFAALAVAIVAAQRIGANR